MNLDEAIALYSIILGVIIWGVRWWLERKGI